MFRYIIIIIYEVPTWGAQSRGLIKPGLGGSY